MSIVLIVEDEMLEQEFLSSVIKAELTDKDKYIIADNGKSAVKMAKTHRPDIIIMDVFIPEMDGLSAMQEIRKFLPDAHVIILSAHSDFTYAQKAISLKVEEYLLKPVKPLEFQTAFRRLFKKVKQQPAKEKAVTQQQEAQKKTEVQSLVDQAVLYIQQNFKEKLTLQMVASHVYLNPQYFSRIFKKALGVTYTDYVNNLKIVYACKLLETTNYPAYRISSECGFTDPSYFNHVFVKQMQVTPKEYKRKIYREQGKGLLDDLVL